MDHRVRAREIDEDVVVAEVIVTGEERCNGTRRLSNAPRAGEKKAVAADANRASMHEQTVGTAECPVENCPQRRGALVPLGMVRPDDKISGDCGLFVEDGDRPEAPILRADPAVEDRTDTGVVVLADLAAGGNVAT
jgi:hypothetical protein